jgi:hypothetical protein
MFDENNITPDGWDTAYRTLHDHIAYCIGEGTPIRFARYDYDADGLPIANFDEVVIKGPAVFVADETSLYGGKESKDFQSEILLDPTWLDLCIVSHHQIKSTRDNRHIYLEGFRPVYYLDRENVQCTIWDGWIDVPVYELLLDS